MTGGPPEPDGSSGAGVSGYGDDDRDFDEPVPDASEQLDVEDNAYSLVDADDVPGDPLDDGIDAPDHWSSAERYGTTDEEQREGESLDYQLAAERPDPVLEEINGESPKVRPRGDRNEPAERAAVTVTDEDSDRDAVMHDGTPEETLQEAEAAVAADMAADAEEPEEGDQ